MTHGLPPVLEEIAGAAGRDVALALAEARGGEKVYFPATPDEAHWLTRLVGIEAARAICQLYGVRNIEIPRGPVGSAHRLRARIARMLEQGASSNDIARACGVAFRTVTRHRAAARAREDEAQSKLF